MTKIKTVLLDMDGVLVDFMKGAHKYHGIPYDYEKNYPYRLNDWDFDKNLPISAKEFWLSLDSWFWDGLAWTAEGRYILMQLEAAFGADNIYLCTTPTCNPASAEGKLVWIAKNLPSYINRYVLTPNKSLLANPETLLVDDSDKNINEFVAKGGKAITIPRKWNSKYPYQDACLTYFSDKLIKEFLNEDK